MPARHVYAGPFATKCKMYAERFYSDSWSILSAKYGFLFPDDIVPGPYEMTFCKPNTNPISLDVLRGQVIKKGLDRYSAVVVLGGRRYASIVAQAIPRAPLSVPLQGCGGIGMMMHHLKSALSSGIPL